MNNKFKIIFIVIISFFIMAIVDAVIVPSYFIKSLIKIILFGLIPIAYFITNKDREIKNIFRINKKELTISLLVGIVVFLIIIGAYFLLGNLFDLSNITSSLTNDIGVSLDNFIYVSIYITIFNSFLEEFFFRGFAFLTLKKYSNLKFSFIFSAITFALYHVAMMITWISIPLLIMTIIGLFIGGLIFNYFNYKYNNLYPSWFIHMFANIAINTIGFILFLN